MKKTIIFLLFFAGLNVFLFAQQNPFFKFYFNGNDVTSIVPVFGNSIFLFGSREAGLGAFNIDSMKYVGILQKLYAQIPSHNIRNIKKFSNDTLWICTDRGLVRYRSNEILILNTNNSPIPSNVVNDIYRDVLGGLWIATSNGLAYNLGDNWTVYNTSNSGIPDDYVTTVKVDPLGNIWVGTPNGIGMFDRNEWYVWNTGNSGLPDNYISFIEFDSFNNSKWIGTLGGGLVNWLGDNFYVFDTTNSPLPSNMVTCFAFDRSRNRWIGTDKGVAFVSQSGWRIFDTSNSQISDNFINAIYIDEQNRKFFGTRNKVSVLIDTNFIVIDFTNSKLPTNNVFKVVEGRDLIKWIATPFALVSFDSNSWQVFDSSNSPLKSNINDINIDQYNNLWVATDSGLFVKSGNSWAEYYYDTANLPSNRILRVLPVKNGVYVGTDSGLVYKRSQVWVRLDTMYGVKLKGIISSLSLVKVPTDYGDFEDKVYAGLGEKGIGVFYKDSVWFIDESNSPLVNMFVTDVAEDNNGRLYVGTREQGVFTYDSVWNAHNPNTGDFPDFNVLDIEVDKENSIWLTTSNGGIVVWQDTLISLLTEDAYPFYTNKFKNVFTDLSNNKWISTEFGLYVYNEDSLKPELKLKPFNQQVCMGNPFFVDFYTFYLFEPGNTFIVQMSDSSGSFDSAFVIGRKQSRSAQPILCLAPRNISPGYTYLLRILSTNPPLMSEFEFGRDRLGIFEVPHPKIYGDTVVCSGNTIKLWAHPKREGIWDLMNSFIWRVEGGTLLSLPTDDTVLVRFDTVTSGRVILKAINELGCEDSTFANVYVSHPPGKILNGQTRVCSGQSFIYSTTDSSQITNIWSVQNGTLEKKLSNNVVIIKWGNTTPGWVILKRINQFGCVDSVKLKVDIFPTPDATIFGKKEVLIESIEKYIGTRLDASVINKWSVTNGLIIGRNDGDTVVVGWNKSGFGKVKLLQRTPAGCFDSSEMVVRIFEHLKVDGDTLVCENKETYFEAVSNLGAYNSWSVQGGTITSEPSSRRVWIRWGPSGTGLVKLVQWFPNTFFKDSIVQIVRIAKLPQKPVISDSGGYLYSSAPFGNQWFFNGRILVGDTNRTIVPLRTGYYTVRVITAPGCESELSDPFYFVSGVDDENETLKIYPNPASNFVEFMTNGARGISELLIRDLTGRELVRYNYEVPVNEKMLDLSNFANGIYIVEVVIGNNRIANRLILFR